MFYNKIFNRINLHQNYKHALVSTRYSLLYIPIPKNACSSTKKWILSLEGFDIAHKHGPHQNLSKRNLFCSKYGNIHKCANNELNFLKNKEKNIKNFYKFTIVRNPWSRTVSAFKDKFCGNYERFKKYEDITFRDFVNKIMVSNNNEHWRPQIDFIKNAKLDKVVRFESITQDMSYITKLKNTPSFPEKSKNYHSDKDLPDYSFVSDIKVNQLSYFKKKNKGLPNYKKFYTPDLIEKIYDFYKEDIIKFGYNFKNNLYEKR